jgi:hypothetical protein
MQLACYKCFDLLLEHEHRILFLASKLFLFGKRLNAKQNLQTTLVVDDKIQFDAVPCEQSENDNSCSWFATVVWKGKKPTTDYDMTFAEPRNLMAEIKHVSIYNSNMIISPLK